MVKIALIGCVKEKLEWPCKAGEIYTGAQFLKWKQDADDWGCDSYYILSGKFGLIHPDTIIAPYDVNLDLQTDAYREEWFQNVAKEINALAKEEIVIKFFCASSYSDGILNLLSEKVIVQR